MPTANGQNGHGAPAQPESLRFKAVPPSIDIPVQGYDETVEIDLEELIDDPTELCTLFENERAQGQHWMAVALGYAKQNKFDHAIEMLIRGVQAVQSTAPREKLPLVSLLCWMYLYKSREVPRVAPDGSDVKTKDYYLGLATTSFNDGSRINPTFPPLFLAKGVLCLMKASLSNHASGKADLLKAAIKSFDDAARASNGRNMLAVMGKAKANFSLGKYPEALAGYQEVLKKMPTMVDPDPRIGIGCCFWHLGYKDDALAAWTRSLEIDPESKIANILLGIYYLDQSGRVPTNGPEFIRLYRKAMTEFTQKAFKLDKDLPLTCATFASYFLSKRNYAHVDSLAHKAIHYTDVNAIASDGWYLLARKEHNNSDVDRASDFYRRADDARGGSERGYFPAKFGAAQLSVMKNDLGEAKLRLEKMVSQHQSKNYETMVLLGTLYAEEVFANQAATVKEDKTEEARKAINLLENARLAWKDPKKNLSPDSGVLLNLARLYEAEHPEKALQCLLHVEKLELEQVSGTESEDLAEKRKFLPPQLLNNIGCFCSLAEKHEIASDMFEAALSSCMRISKTGEEVDTDALVTTISFNLGRSYEYRGLVDKAVEVYDGLLERHDDYADARTRVAYIKLRKHPAGEGPEKVSELYKENRSDLEVRALYGWFLGKVSSRKRPANIAEDPELRHYKHTLQHHDKHDRYALVGMGNLYLISAREMKRDTAQDKQKRSATYSRAVEFFDKALQLDPNNAYAAQGVAIALVEDKRDFKNALPIFLKVRETIKDANVHVNLGHIYGELRQYSKAIESYEAALAKEGKSKDAGILSCLGRTHLNKGRAEKSLDSYKKSLEYAQKALDVAPEQVHFKFNLAFVQIQLVSVMLTLGENQRSVAELEEAQAGLEAAIEALDEIAQSPQPPYPKHDIEQRASMARNTQRKQLDRAIASQKEYEEKNREKLAAAMEHREAERRKREEEREHAREKERERQEKIRKEREAIAAQDRLLIERRKEEEEAQRAAEYETDNETGEKIKKKRKAAPRSTGEPKKSRPRKKKAADGDESEESQPKKKRRLATKENSKFKSAEIVVDSDDDEEDPLERAERALEGQRDDTPESDNYGGRGSNEDDGKMDVDEPAEQGNEYDSDAGAVRRPNRARARILDDSDEDGEEATPAADASMADVDGDDSES